MINLKPLNQFLQAEHFKMEGIHTLRDIVKPGDWLGKVDLIEGCLLHHPNPPILQGVSKVQISGDTIPVQLPPIWPVLGTLDQALKPVIALLREMGVWIIVYIDDMLILAETKEMTQEALEALIYLLECVGFIINWKKSVLEPQQTIEFLGLMTNTTSMVLSLYTTSGKDKEDSCRSAKNGKTDGDISQRAVSPVGQLR